MKAAHPEVRRQRARAAVAGLAVVMGILALAFFRIQVVKGSAWALQSESNRLRVVQVPAPRGTIFDRYGRVIAENVPSFTVSLFPAALDSMQSSLERLGPILGLDSSRVQELMEQARADRRQPLVVLRNAEYEAVAALEELRANFPGVSVEMLPKRRYVGDAAVGHIMGYVGEVSGAELETPRFEGYEAGMVVGKDGLERQYEPQLQGVQGVRYVEVDAVGRMVGSFDREPAAAAVPGTDLHLTVDLELMEFIHRIFPSNYDGAVVLLNVADGGILALYSSPSYDPNAFVGGIDSALWEELNRDPRRPLFNRAVLGRYPPASTFKLATAAIALQLGVVDPQEVMPVPCTGTFRYGNVVKHCWWAPGHGYLDLAGAIANSCNVYFYQLGLRIGLERLVEEASGLGFGERCGVDLPFEARGVFPASLAYWPEQFGYMPFENEVLFMAIGQGPNDQTPLKMAQFYMAIARDGSAPAPHLASLEDGQEVAEAWSLDLSEESLAALREGLRQVTQTGGTAYRSTLEYWDIIGKTGTAQRGPQQPISHAWFIGLVGPWDAPPEVAVAVMVEEGASGSAMAAPIAAKAADFYLRRKYGIAVDTIQTLREHQEAGVPWRGRVRVP
ncbi:MAG: penicillin-binding protein 2 [Gemmatimonadetes bacterium]|nr:penicillin-binding protein 2 [Gemmatimonadota bacterium]